LQAPASHPSIARHLFQDKTNACKPADTPPANFVCSKAEVGWNPLGDLVSYDAAGGCAAAMGSAARGRRIMLPAS
jgi:hypothetical protein